MLSAVRRLFARRAAPVEARIWAGGFLRNCSANSPPLPDPLQAPPGILKQLMEEEEKQLGMTKPKKRKKKVMRVKMDPFDHSNRPLAVMDSADVKALRKTGFALKARKLKVIDPPDEVTRTLDKMFEGEFVEIGSRVDQYLATGVTFRRFISSRRIPSEGRFLVSARRQIEAEVREQYEMEHWRAVEEESLYKEMDVETKVQKKTEKIFDLKVGLGQWVPIEFDENASWAYLLGKAAFDYAVVKTIFDEIRSRTESENFAPRTLFDFGSGVGTCAWAMKETFGEITEYLSVDDSRHMNSLMRTIVSKGRSRDPLPAGFFNRINLPMDSSLKYDVVVAAFSLLELPSEKNRMGLIEELWQRTGEFLVLVEVGTNAGFQAIAEARHQLLQTVRKAEKEGEVEAGHLFSPCPHEKGCPRFERDTIPCNFYARYRNFPLRKMPPAVRDLTLVDQYSYVVFRKGSIREEPWPRVVEQPLRNKTNVVCRLCTKEGSLEETFFRKNVETKEEKVLYKYAKQIKCGQQFKVHLQYKDAEGGGTEENEAQGAEEDPELDPEANK